MTAALSPDLAIAYVRELSADVRAAAVLGSDGARLAGPVGLAAPARELLAALGDASQATVRRPTGVVVAARGPEHSLVAVAGPLALSGPLLLDARAAVGAAADGSVAPPSAALETAADGAIGAL